MSDSGRTTPVSRGTPSSKLDNASKEDLIKLLKKQQLLLKKSNSDNDAAKTTLKQEITNLGQDNESLRGKVWQRVCIWCSYINNNLLINVSWPRFIFQLSQLSLENEQIYQSNQKLKTDLQLLEDSITEDNKLSETQILALEKKISHISSEREDFLSELIVLRDTRDQLRQVMMDFQETDTRNDARIEDLEGELVVEKEKRDTEADEWRKLCDSLEISLNG